MKINLLANKKEAVFQPLQKAFRNEEKVRPLYARAANDNKGFLRVLKKCDFTICDQGKRFTYVRGEDVEEYILKLGI